MTVTCVVTALIDDNVGEAGGSARGTKLQPLLLLPLLSHQLPVLL